MSNIVRISIKNFMSVSDVVIEPGQINQIVGDNGQGKTTIVKAIEWAAKGGGDASLIKIGEDSAEVILELPDDTVIRRRINEKGDATVSVTRAGFKAPSPQAYLDSLFSTSSLNPIEILEAKKRNEALLQAIDVKVTPQLLSDKTLTAESHLPPLDYDQHGLKVIDQAHKYFYQRRAEANKDAMEKRKRWQVNKEQLGEIPFKLDHTADQIRSMIQAEESILHAASNKVVEIEKKRIDQAGIADKVTRSEAILKSIETEIAKLTEEGKRFVNDLKVKHTHALEMLKANQEMEMTALINKIAADVEALKSRMEQGKQYLAEIEVSEKIAEPVELKAQVTAAEQKIISLKLQLKDAELLTSWMKQEEMVNQLDVEATDAERFAKDLDRKVEALNGPIKKDLMASAEMPVEGLEYRDGEFFVNDVSIDNLSTSESITLAVAISRKLAKATKIICIDGAEALDASTWAMFRKQIEGDGFTYFISKVGDQFQESGKNDKTIVMKQGKALTQEDRV